MRAPVLANLRQTAGVLLLRGIQTSPITPVPSKPFGSFISWAIAATPGATLKSKHRIENTHATENLVFVEVQSGMSFEEEDIIRLDDDYGRID